MFTNSQILSAVINKWAQPLINTMLSGKIQSFGPLQNIESWVRSIGIVGPNWSLMKDLSPLMEGATGSILAPVLNKYLSQVDDQSIPKLAHDIVDNALKKEYLALMDGKVVIEKEDLIELKKLLDYNLPIKPESVYEVITEDPNN